MRRNMPEAPRAFRTPLVPLVPILGIATCLFMMVFLPLDTWIRLIVWMMVGFDVYLFYGMRYSKLNGGLFTNKSYKTVSVTGLGMTVLLIVVALLHHSMAETDDTILFNFSIAFAVLHFIIYFITMRRGRKDLA
jgi:APA family basic amino acid/polyamine antiporter